MRGIGLAVLIGLGLGIPAGLGCSAENEAAAGGELVPIDVPPPPAPEAVHSAVPLLSWDDLDNTEVVDGQLRYAPSVQAAADGTVRLFGVAYVIGSTANGSLVTHSLIMPATYERCCGMACEHRPTMTVLVEHVEHPWRRPLGTRIVSGEVVGTLRLGPTAAKQGAYYLIEDARLRLFEQGDDRWVEIDLTP